MPKKSSKDFKEILDFIPVGVFETDSEGNCIFVNKAWQEITGLSSNEAMGQGWAKALHPEDQANIFEEWNKSVEEKRPFELNYRFKKPCGEVVWVHGRSIGVTDSSNNVVKYVGSVMDITKEYTTHMDKMKEFTNLLESTPSCLKIIGINGELISMNRQGLGLIGAMNFEEVEGACVFDLVTEEHRQNFIEFHNRVCEGDEDSLTFEIEALDGTRKWMETYASPYELPDGKVGHIAITNDISEKIRKKEKMDLAEEKYKDLFTLNEGILNSSNNGILVINHKSRKVEKANHKFFDIWNIPDEMRNNQNDGELIGYVLSQIKEPEKFVSEVERLYKTPLEESSDEIKLNDGRTLGRESYPLIKDGDPICRIWVFLDITERKIAEEDVEEQKRLAHHHSRLASIGELAAGVGHEINNPLMIAKGFIEMTQKGLDREDLEQKNRYNGHLDKSIEALSRIAKIVDGLRTFARAGSNKPESFDLVNAIEQTVDLVSEIYRQTEIELSFGADEETNGWMAQGSIGALQQIMMNLLSNAKYAVRMQDKKSIAIRVKSSRKRDAYVITVEDSGCGIPKENIEKVFFPFFTTKPVNEGTGIGLATTYSLVQELGGTIKVFSEQDKGTKFVITVPAHKVDISNEKSIHEEADKIDRQTEFRMTGQILIVDDEIAICDVLQDFLEDEGHTVHLAHSGADALTMMDKNDYDLILTDFVMPKMNGLTLAKKIRASGSKHPQFVLMTGGVNFDFESEDSELKTYFADYVLKPFEFSKVIEVIDRQLKSVTKDQTQKKAG